MAIISTPPIPPITPIPYNTTFVNNVELSMRREVANAKFTVEFDIHWSEFDQATNFEYTEELKLVEQDPNRQEDVWTGPFLLGGTVSSNGHTTTHRAHPVSGGEFTIPWSDLDKDPTGDDEILAVVTLTPRLPVAVTAQSEVVTVQSP